MKTLRLNICLSGLVLLAACAKAPPSISVSELLENPRLLEATIVRCARNRAETKYAADCVNARYVASRLEYRAMQKRRAALEAQSTRKRQALRRTQEAAAEARRRVLEAKSRREEAEYLGVYEGATPAGTGRANDAASASDIATGAERISPGSGISTAEADRTGATAAVAKADTGAASDLESIREELQRRHQNPR